MIPSACGPGACKAQIDDFTSRKACLRLCLILLLNLLQKPLNSSGQGPAANLDQHGWPIMEASCGSLPPPNPQTARHAAGKQGPLLDGMYACRVVHCGSSRVGECRMQVKQSKGYTSSICPLMFVSSACNRGTLYLFSVHHCMQLSTKSSSQASAALQRQVASAVANVQSTAQQKHAHCRILS